MLVISQDLVDAIIEHARAEHPIEACGVVVGPDSDSPSTHVPLVNIARSETFYEIGSTELLRLYQGLDRTGDVLSVIYHSHPSGPARPSRTDVELASEPAAHYVVVSANDFRSFRIIDATATEEEVRVVPSAAANRPRLVTP